ncbi:hypothetical protein [Aquisalimonas sp.]|uniref:hypothetical protein n=1 Tax=Aquisalimonas sp. TaxID=1872621 RepID=UPI0025BA2FDB|nr:hypothetical protein [Aquisalimonas sp.]
MLTILLVAGVIVLYLARHILLAALLGFVLANLLYHMGVWTAGRTGAHWAIWTSVYLAIGVGLLAIIARYGAPVITEQGSAFGKTLGEAMVMTRTWLEQRHWGQRLLEANGDSADVGQRLMSVTANFLGSIWNSLGFVPRGATQPRLVSRSDCRIRCRHR